MSKAFTSESDDDESVISPPPLPPGTRNYMTPDGARKLSEERDRLTAERAALTSGDFDRDRRRKAIDRRLEFLNGRLDAAQIVDPAQQAPDQIRFGATMTLRSTDGTVQEWRIVGFDEVDLDKFWISWMAPLAAALLEKKVGDRVVFQGKALTVEKIQYV